MYVLGDDTSIRHGSSMRTKHLCVYIHIRICFAVLYVPCSLVVTCRERAGLLALLRVVFSCLLSLFNVCLARCFFCGSFLLLSMIHVYLYYTVLSVPCSRVITCCERAGLLPLSSVMFPCVFVTFKYEASGQMWYLVVLVPGLYLLVYFYHLRKIIRKSSRYL